MNLERFERLIAQKIASIASSEDPAHDILHFHRVVATAKRLCRNEGGQMEIVVPAAWLHDFVIVPKNDPRRREASKLSAEGAILFLREIGYPEIYLADIAHAIEAHSFSANIETRTLEAAIVQDADRLDALGAIGIARCFVTAGLMRRSFYSEQDPFCVVRTPNDQLFTVDHFYVKLFKTVETLKTKSSRDEGHRRVEVMKRYLHDFSTEIGSQA